MDRITLNKRYQIIEKIGGGGMAEVFHGYDTLLNRDIAIKMLRDQYIEEKDFVERFRQEACSAAQLLHPNIVNIYDVGHENNFYYIVMEHVVGPTLKEYIKEHGKLNPIEALHIASGIASGLVQAHIHNIVHCDIKSQNILIDDTGCAKITDFGIAKATNEVCMEKSDEVMGSVYYLSPEQACGQNVTPQSDLYSLGVVLFEMLTGRLPFDADTPIKIALQHVKNTIPSLQTIDPNLPQCLNAITEKALAKNPAFRYKSAQEFLADMKRAEALIKGSEDNNLDDTVRFVSLDGPTPEVGVNDETMIINKEAMLDKIANYNPPKETVPVVKPKKQVSKKALLTFIVGLIMLVVIGYSVNEFTKPTVVVPDLTGKTIVEAEDILTDLKLNYALAEEFNSSVKSGQVCRQVPAANSSVKEGRKIRLIISKGVEVGVAPDLKGKTITQAKEILRLAGINLGNTVVRYEEGAAPDVIISQSIAPKEKVAKDAKIDLVVNISAKQTVVPNIIGKSVEEAKDILTSKDLKLGSVTKTESDKTVNTIIGASSDIGGICDKGTTVNVEVAIPKPPKPAPKPENVQVVEFVIPGDAAMGKKPVKIVVNNEKGAQVVYSGSVAAGSRLRQQISIVGKTDAQLFVDDALVEDKTF